MIENYGEISGKWKFQENLDENNYKILLNFEVVVKAWKESLKNFKLKISEIIIIIIYYYGNFMKISEQSRRHFKESLEKRCYC